MLQCRENNASLLGYAICKSKMSTWRQWEIFIDRIPVGGEIFRTRPDRSWGPPNLLYTRYEVFHGGVKRPGRDVDHPPLSSVDAEGRVELYIYSPLWAFVSCSRRNLPLPYSLITSQFEATRSASLKYAAEHTIQKHKYYIFTYDT